MTTWMDPEWALCKVKCQAEKDKYCMISLTCENQKHQTHRYGEQAGWLPEAGHRGWRNGRGSPKVEESGYKVREVLGYNVQHSDGLALHPVIAKKIELKISQH